MLNRVTVTGADDKTDIDGMVQLSKKYPFLEFGILVSKECEGRSRFPTIEWQLNLRDKVSKHNLDISCHICDSWVEKILLGDNSCFNNTLVNPYPPILDKSKRVQLNTHGMLHLFNINKFKDFVEGYLQGKQIICQFDNVNDAVLYASIACNIDAVPLFDLSHGAGILPSKWPNPVTHYNGYAGGLSPENAAENIEKINTVSSNSYFMADYWVDSETKVMNKWNTLDLDKVDKFAENCEPYVVTDIFKDL